MGRKVRQFEKELAQRLRLPGAVMVDSGSNALYLAVQLLHARGLALGAEIVVPSFTWVACASAVLLGGNVPVFADVDLATQNVTPETIAKAMSPRTGAVMVVHYAGKPVNVPALRSFNVPVIEDAAHAVDSRLGDSYCGSMGDVAIYSFDAIKNLATPEGGAITARDPAVLELAREYRYCGIRKSGFANAVDSQAGRWWEQDVRHIWPKMLPNDVSAGIGLAQLRKLDGLQRRRKEIWDRYQRELAGLPWLALPAEAASDEQHSYFTYLVRVLHGKRDELARYLLDNGVYTTLRYRPLHLEPIYGSKARLSVCELLNEQGLNLPLHPALTDEHVSKVIELIRKSR
jgi:aminotransferase